METVLVQDMQTGREAQTEVVTTNVADHPELMQQPAWVQPGGWVEIQGPQEQASELPPTPGTPLNQDLFDLGSASPSRSPIPIEDWREALEIAHRRTPAPGSDFVITPQLDEGMQVKNLEQELARTKEELREANQVILEHQNLAQNTQEQKQYIQQLLQERHEVATENQLRFEQLEQQHQLQIQQLKEAHQAQLQELEEHDAGARNMMRELGKELDLQEFLAGQKAKWRQTAEPKKARLAEEEEAKKKAADKARRVKNANKRREELDKVQAELAIAIQNKDQALVDELTLKSKKARTLLKTAVKAIDNPRKRKDPPAPSMHDLIIINDSE